MNHKGTEGEESFKITEISSITYTLCTLCAFVVKIPRRNISLSVVDRTLDMGIMSALAMGQHGTLVRRNSSCCSRKTNVDGQLPPPPQA